MILKCLKGHGFCGIVKDANLLTTRSQLKLLMV